MTVTSGGLVKNKKGAIMSALGIVALVFLGILICFFVFVLGTTLGYYACYAKAYEEAEADHKDLSDGQRKLIEVLKSQNIAYKKMFEESCEVEVDTNTNSNNDKDKED